MKFSENKRADAGNLWATVIVLCNNYARRLRHNIAMLTLHRLRVVLVAPTHPGNIGAVARAMANMGVAQLTLVRPRDFPHPTATARAAGAQCILEQARRTDSLAEAVADCALVLGSSARPRSIHWPTLSPPAAMRRAAATAAQSPVALVFGCESRGLSNRELEYCHYLVRIDVDANYPSLNLAAAAMVLLYELRKTTVADGDMETGDAADHPSAALDDPNEPRAIADEMRHFYRHSRRVLQQLDFSDDRDAKLHRKLIRMFNRARPYAREIRILRGILTQIERKLKN